MRARGRWWGVILCNELFTHGVMQENGSYYGCRDVNVSEAVVCFTVQSGTPFSFNLSPYTQEELGTNKHQDDLVESGSIILCGITK